MVPRKLPASLIPLPLHRGGLGIRSQSESGNEWRKIMTLIRAEDWIRELAKAVQNEHLTQDQANDEVFAEMETGDHDAATERMYFNFTRNAA